MDWVAIGVPSLVAGLIGGLIALMAAAFRGGRAVVLKPELEVYRHSVLQEFDRFRNKEVELRREIKRVEDYARDTYMLRSDLMLLVDKVMARIDRLESKIEGKKR